MWLVKNPTKSSHKFGQSRTWPDLQVNRISDFPKLKSGTSLVKKEITACRRHCLLLLNSYQSCLTRIWHHCVCNIFSSRSHCWGCFVLLHSNTTATLISKQFWWKWPLSPFSEAATAKPLLVHSNHSVLLWPWTMTFILDPDRVKSVGWSLTSIFSTNMAIPDKPPPLQQTTSELWWLSGG